ncbi:MAG: putative Zn-dependent protease [Firmicutes bacterium]|nr:putative Zn-dependent protease [Bacillota bacterium]
MIEKIKEILANHKDISGYKIKETTIHSNELFFVKKNVDMDRAKRVHHYNLTVYVDFTEDGMNYKGSSNTDIHPTMNDTEIESAIRETAFAAKFVKNPYYPLVQPAESQQASALSAFAKESFPYWMNEITKAIYKNDIYEKGGINSCEIFLDKIETRIVNSEGVDVTDTGYRCMIEFITTWKEEGEEIELYRRIDCSDFDEELFAEEVKNMITICRERAIATSTPALKTASVILTREAVKDFFSYYYSKSNAASVYNQSSTWKVGDQLQGKEVKGDRITMTLDPFMKNSTDSESFDSEGFPLKPVKLIEDGELKRYAADTRYAYYLGVVPTGNIGNIIIESGSKTIEELKKEPYLMTTAFSDFTVDTMTGDFCGEIRLATYFDGRTTTPVTGGSVTGNINELHHELYLSRERSKDNNFEGPAMIMLKNVTVAGIAKD